MSDRGDPTHTLMHTQTHSTTEPNLGFHGNRSEEVVCSIRVCVCVCLQSVAWQPKFQRPISLSTRLSGLGDCKVARVGRPATDHNLVVRLWESGI